MTDSNNRSTSPKPVSCATVPDGAKRTAAGSSAAKTVIASIWHTGGGKYAMIVIGLWVAVSAYHCSGRRTVSWTPMATMSGRHHPVPTRWVRTVSVLMC